MTENRFDDSWDDSFAERVDATLRRRFAPPNTITASSVPVTEPASPPRPMAWSLAVLAAAVVLVVVAELGRGPAEVELDAPLRGARGVAVVEAPAWVADVSVGPLESEAPLEPVSPDLGAMYEEARVYTRDPNWNSCGDELAQQLEASFEQPIDLSPLAAGRFQGPFSSEEWPSGAMLTGLSDGETTVVVVERESMHLCCLDLHAPSNPELNVFHWGVGNVVLTEITPHSEPRLLELFEGFSGPR